MKAIKDVHYEFYSQRGGKKTTTKDFSIACVMAVENSIDEKTAWVIDTYIRNVLMDRYEIRADRVETGPTRNPSGKRRLMR